MDKNVPLKLQVVHIFKKFFASYGTILPIPLWFISVFTRASYYTLS
jgi:hypothetical protein